MKLRSAKPQRLLLQTIDTLLANPNARVLDVGAGSVVEKNRRAGQLALADKYELLVRQRGYIGLDVEPGANVMLVADAHALPIANASLDGVIMVSVLEHLYDPIRAVNEVARVLKRGGLYFSYAPFYHPYHASPHDYFRFTREGYLSLLREFSKVEIVSGGNYIAVANDLGAYAFGGSRGGRALARVLVEFPLSLFFRAFDSRGTNDIAVGFAALAVR
ncbi:MAG TPA: class I SAM-dependent methyltransferase [Anaerolineae bacterium]|nr:class I SAM-dependent methyltransferase [Anaerolineae bacterium]